MKSPRKICFESLLRIEQDNAFSNIIADSIMKRTDITDKDKSFVCALFYGVIERKITLDYIISLFSKMKLKKLDKKVLVLLRMGAYQIMYMDKIPDSAAVNETVALCSGAGVFSAKGFVNGILRNISRQKDSIDFSKLPKDDYLSVMYSCNRDIVSHLSKFYGDDITEAYLKTLFGTPPLTVRVNTLKTDDEKLIALLDENGIKAEKHSGIKNALNIVSGSNKLFTSKAFSDGLFHVQDASSQLCCNILNPKPGESVVDVCACPGGKSVTLAGLLENKGRIIACDLHENKLSLINDTAIRLGTDIISTFCRDASSDDNLNGLKADKVLCDVPCSGLGILRRKPEIKYKDLNDIKDLPQLQYKILCQSAKLLKNGGELVYSTCTLNPFENNYIAERFLKEHKDFKAKKLPLPDGVKRIIKEEENVITLFPQSSDSDGFFISLFVKEE